jgi:outer membrane receptor for monomeric catechols
MSNPRTFNYKKIISIIIIAAWIIFSAIYIANDQWKDFQTIKIQQAYRTGVSESVRALMQEASQCAPVPIFDGDNKIEVIAVQCLQQDEQQQ